MAAVLPPDPREPIRRAEFESMVTLFHDRVARVERLCFEDDDERPSLQTFILTMDNHRKVMCAWANGFKKVCKLASAGAMAISSVALALHQIGLWPF